MSANDNKNREEGGPSMGTLSFISCAAGSETGAPDSPSEKEPEGKSRGCSEMLWLFANPLSTVLFLLAL